MRAGVGFALVVAILAALMVNALARQAADQLRSHIPTQTGDVETALMLGGRAKSGGFHNHNLLPVLRRFGGGAV